MTKKEVVTRINNILRRGMYDLPPYRRTVTKSGKNVQWLLKNFTERNSFNDELNTLLNKLSGM